MKGLKGFTSRLFRQKFRVFRDRSLNIISIRESFIIHFRRLGLQRFAREGKNSSKTQQKRTNFVSYIPHSFENVPDVHSSKGIPDGHSLPQMNSLSG